MPVYRFAPTDRRHCTEGFDGSPEFNGAQFVPPFVVEETPTPSVPANSNDPFATRLRTAPPKGPLVTTHCADENVTSIIVIVSTVSVFFILAPTKWILRKENFYNLVFKIGLCIAGSIPLMGYSAFENRMAQRRTRKKGELCVNSPFA